MMTKADQYLVSDIHNILDNGYPDENPRPVYADGTPAHTISVNHVTRRYDLSKGEFPICTLRHQAWKTGIREIFTIYQHPTNVLSEMRDQGVTWWDPWDIGDGTIGQRYGATVGRYDLIHKLIEDIRKDPYGRRKIVDLWQEPDLRETPGLAPCAFLTIWNVRREYLDMCLIQRSGDMLTASGAGGINEIQYAALLMMIAPTSRFMTAISKTHRKCCAGPKKAQTPQVPAMEPPAANRMKNRTTPLLPLSSTAGPGAHLRTLRSMTLKW